MKKATAKRTFQRTDTKEIVRAGDRIIATEAYINELERVGMVRNVIALPSAPETKVAQVPTRAAGERSSVSPAAQALLDQTRNSSGAGGRRRRKTQSL